MQRFAFLLFGLCTALTALAQEEEAKVTFDDHIKPILREHCTTCHSQSDKSGGLALDSYSELMLGGSSGEVLSSGRPDASRLYALVTHQQQPYMPPDEDPISKEKLDLIKTWIDQGMPENMGSKIKRANQAAAAMLGNASTGKPEGPPPMPLQMLRQTVLETDRPAAIAALTASPWAPLVAVGGQEQVVLYHSDNGELMGIIPFPEGDPQSLSFTRDGRQLLIGGGRHGHSGCAVLVDIASGDRIAKVGDELDIVLAADISPDKKLIALAGPGRVVRVFDSLSGQLLRELKKHTDWIYSLRFSPDSVLLASGDRSNGLVLWEADSGNIYADLPGHRGSITSVDFRSDSNVLASASLDGTVKFWDLIEVKEIRSWAAHDGGTQDAQFANDGSLATAGKEGKVKLWNGNGELLKEFPGMTEAALRVAIVGDGSVIAAGDWNGQALLWRTDNPSSSRTIAANPPSIERRLADANQAFIQAEQELVTVSEQARLAQEQSMVASQLLVEKQQMATSLAAQLAEAASAEVALQSSIVQSDERIAALEAELAELRSKRQTFVTDLEAKRLSVQSLTSQSTEAQQLVELSRVQAEQSQSAAQAARQLTAEAQQRREAASSAAQKATSDKEQLEKQSTELTQMSLKAVQEAKQLSEQIAAAIQQEQSDADSVEKLTVELTALQDRLATLQQKVDELSGSRLTATQKLNATQSTTSQLRQQASQAEQAAVEAHERLKLFEQVYRKPSK